MNTVWIDIIGLFLLIAGFIIGLGAVTVIDLHGFFAQKSPYWTEATIRSHKITKPLIWLGLFFAIIGGLIYYRNTALSPLLAVQIVLAIVLIINGIFLSFGVSPELLRRERIGKAKELLPQSLQLKIIGSFLVSFIGWWTEVFLLVISLV